MIVDGAFRCCRAATLDEGASVVWEISASSICASSDWRLLHDVVLASKLQPIFHWIFLT